MDVLYSLLFGAGVGAFTFSRFGRRLGYGNARNVWLIVGIATVMGAVFFYTFARFVLNIR